MMCLSVDGSLLTGYGAHTLYVGDLSSHRRAMRWLGNLRILQVCVQVAWLMHELLGQRICDLILNE